MPDSLEVNLCTDLHGAWVMPVVDAAKGAVATVKDAVGDIRVNRARVAMIERVEGLETKLQTDAFAEVYVFDQRDVPQLEPWPQNGARALSTEVPGRWSKSSGIEEFRCSFRSVRITDQVCTELSGGSARQVETGVVVSYRGEGIVAALSDGRGLT